MANETTSADWLLVDVLPGNGSQVRDDGVINGNVSDDVMPAVKAAADKEAVDRLLRLSDKLILSIICVGLVGNTIAFSALSSRGCRGRRRRWRTHHALAILLQVDNLKSSKVRLLGFSWFFLQNLKPQKSRFRLNHKRKLTVVKIQCGLISCECR